MLGDSNGEPSLGSLYRQLVSRLARAIQRAGASSFNQQAYHQLDEIRIKLEAWADLVGVKKDVLEAVDDDGGPLANATRDSFLQLLEAMDHVEMKLGLREEPSDGSGVRPDALTHLRILFQSSLMDRTGHFTAYVSTARRGGPTPLLSRASDSPAAATAAGYPTRAGYPNRSASKTPNRRSNASTPRDVGADASLPDQPGFEYSVADTAIIKLETPASGSMFLDSSDASRSRPSTAESARRPSTAGLYAISPQSGYPNMSHLLSSPQYPDNLAQQTPSTASSISSPPTPWTPYQPAASPFATGPTAGRQAPQTAQEAWSGVVLSPILVGDPYHTPRRSLPSEGPRPMEPPTQSAYKLPAELQPGFKSEGWLAGDDPRSGSSSGWKGA